MAKNKKVAASQAASVNMPVLAALVQAGASGMFLTQADAASLVGHNPPLAEMSDFGGKTAQGADGYATRATPAGVEHFGRASQGGQGQQAPAPAPQSAASKFKIVTAPTPAPKERLAPREATYPFADLGPRVGDQSPSFFIPATAEVAEPWDKYASTVSSAQRRFAVARGTKQVTRKKKDNEGNVLKDNAGNEIMETVTVDNMVPTRRFTIREVEDGTLWGFPNQKGAAVYRIDDGQPSQA